MDFKNLNDDLLESVVMPPQGDFLEVCYNGCCCGKEEKGNAPVRKEAYESRYAISGLSGTVELRFLPCLDFCREANTVHICLDGKDFYFRKMNDKEDIDALFQFAATRSMSQRLARKILNP